MVKLFEEKEYEKAIMEIANLSKASIERLDVFLDYWQKVFWNNLSSIDSIVEDKVALKRLRSIAASLNALREIQRQIHSAPSEVKRILQSDKSAKEKEKEWNKLTEESMSRMQGFEIIKLTPKGGKNAR